MTRRRGFSLLELLTVVFILGVLVAIAVPLYANTRRASQARACRANLAAIAAAESAWALRNGAYTASVNGAYVAPVGSGTATGGLVGAPEGLAMAVYCPLDGSTAYTATLSSTGALTIACPNASTHAQALSPASLYSMTLAAPVTETIP
jgi:type IV pilus assembly protein PilA